ncbi:lon protease homolog 2, peroxisomal-like [Oppia nitens]|uniref:lon protease homolog 2, peroxisomal-like n=1 Tax=Oppia nitens TaxID=1686743 RepID=UPI0023DB9910|nr:lon protease homolog 2, peroxisomal-like [Oppia nitens]
MTTNSIRLPRRLPILIIDGVLFPGSSIRIPVTSYRNMSMVRSHLLNRSTLSSAIIGVVPKEIVTNTSNTSTAEEDNKYDDNCMHSIGCAGIVVQVTGTNWPRPSYTLLVTGLCRFKLDSIVIESPYLVGLVQQLDKLSVDDIDINEDNSELSDLKEQFREQASRLIDMLDLSVPAVVRLKRLMNSLPVQSLPDVCAAIVRASHSERLQILDSVDLAERFRKTLPLLMRQIEGLQLLQKAKKDGTMTTQTLQMDKLIDIGRHNRVDIEDEDMDDSDDIASIERKIKLADIPETARKVAMKELSRLKKMPTHIPDHAIVRNYLELMTELPWNKTSPELLDLKKSRQDLDADHYGLDKLKQRVLEYLAVRQLKNTLKGPILCFVGPPGVGKTSIGRSIARSLGREFHRISLGGACDQADIRGHRRTYIGSMPGRIIQGLKTVGVKNPVFLLDEIDKMGSGIHGDPAAALLEVLDPEQNCAFTDHYLNVPFDLSQVLFIATANTTSTIPAALLDRMEVLSLPGYTHEEKLHIAKHHLVHKQLKEHGLSYETLDLSDDALAALISKYTREAGVRNLERKIGAVCRAIAVKVVVNSCPADDTANIGGHHPNEVQIIDNIVDSQKFPILVNEAAVEDILGAPLYENELTARVALPGIAIGMAWTTVGGEIMFVEATKMEGDGQLILTGQLGDVMKESAKLALNWVRTHINNYAIETNHMTDIMDGTDVHIHFPAGAVGKDGPSAGVTIVTALISLFSKKVVSSDVAMTGEITLRGLVLPVGGIKSKVLAAHRAGIRRVILPKRNEKDLKEIPTSIQGEIFFNFVSHIDEVIEYAFDGRIALLNSHSNRGQLESKL